MQPIVEVITIVFIMLHMHADHHDVTHACDTIVEG